MAMGDKIRMRLLTHAYIKPTTKAGDIVEVSLEEAQRLLELGAAEPACKGD